jgi:hypothetical protein
MYFSTRNGRQTDRNSLTSAIRHIDRRIEPLKNKPDAVDAAEKAHCRKLQETPWDLWKMWKPTCKI